ncbi:MAG TPA: 50S ribosomal protein L7ae [Candidatus Krumholzibacteria bacterium]|nr:50S ribosomal protein L7ae [Candidatus Krumholzibacteria bacterium]HRX50358.1 50S ribosomal protein L7ae [Candidatus Krumholzibacteria bacterium]
MDAPQREVVVARLLGLLGLAQRAGKLALGGTAAAQMIAGPRPALLIVARDAGQGAKKLSRLVPRERVVDGIVDRAELARAFQRDDLTVVAVEDRGFVKGILELVAGAGAGGERPASD